MTTTSECSRNHEACANRAKRVHPGKRAPGPKPCRRASRHAWGLGPGRVIEAELQRTRDGIGEGQRGGSRLPLHDWRPIRIPAAHVGAGGSVDRTRKPVVRSPVSRLQRVPDGLVVRPVYGPHREHAAVDMLRDGDAPSGLVGEPILRRPAAPVRATRRLVGEPRPRWPPVRSVLVTARCPCAFRRLRSTGAAPARRRSRLPLGYSRESRMSSAAPNPRLVATA